MKETCEKIKGYLKENKTMSTTEFWLSIAVALLSGIILGFLFSPKRQKTTYIGSNNGNNSGNYGNDKDVEDDCDCCEDCCADCDEEKCCGEYSYCGKDEKCCEDNWDEAYEEAEADNSASEKGYIKIQ